MVLIVAYLERYSLTEVRKIDLDSEYQPNVQVPPRHFGNKELLLSLIFYTLQICNT